jgi:hypothetical protein
MTRDERLELIAKLKADNEASMAELERRAAEREADPAKMHRYLYGDAVDRRDSGDDGDLAFSAPLERKSGSPAGLVYREQEDGLLPFPEPVDEACGDNDPIPEALDEFSAATAERFRRLDNELAYLRGQLDAALGMLGVKSGNTTTVVNPELEQKSGNTPTGVKPKSAAVVGLPPRPGIIRRRNDGNAA